MKKSINDSINKIFKNLLKENDDFHPGDTAFIMLVAKKKGIKKFNTAQEVYDFIKNEVAPHYTITRTEEGDIYHILENYPKYLEDSKEREATNHTLRSFAKELPFDQEEIEPYLEEDDKKIVGTINGVTWDMIFDEFYNQNPNVGNAGDVMRIFRIWLKKLFNVPTEI